MSHDVLKEQMYEELCYNFEYTPNCF